MDLETAIKDSRINVFDIIPDKKSYYGFTVFTYRKPNESDNEWYERNNLNFEKALQLKRKK